MNTYVIQRRSGWASRDELEKAAGRSARVGQAEMPDRVRWIRSYVTQEPDQRLGTVCVYQATDPAAIREHAKRAGLPCDLIVPVAETVVINDDPRVPA
jgi:Protein of unknown function (DUF4242)